MASRAPPTTSCSGTRHSAEHRPHAHPPVVYTVGGEVMKMSKVDDVTLKVEFAVGNPNFDLTMSKSHRAHELELAGAPLEAPAMPPPPSERQGDTRQGDTRQEN